MSLLNKLESKIDTGFYIEGTKLPSIRKLSETYQCSKSTVIKALQELEKRHMIYSIPKSGYYVIKKRTNFSEDNKDEFDFATSSPAWDQFPYLDFQHCMNKAIDTYQQSLFVYGTHKGLPSLIKTIKTLLETYQVFTQEENIFITSGIQQALSLLNSLTFPNNKSKIVIEQPGYHLFIEHLLVHKIPVIGIKRTAGGIDLNELEMIFSSNEIKFFYTMPRFQNPLGTSYSRIEKEAIIKLAIKYDVYIVEDDYLADFERDNKIDPIFSYDMNDRVIYLKSFSKIMFPGLRVGAVVVPKALIERFQQYKRISDIDSSMISQAALEIYINSGMFERHKQKVSLSYLERANILYKSFESSDNSQLIIRPKTLCMKAHIPLPKSINVPALMERLSRENVRIDPINRNYLPGFHQEKILKLDVSKIDKSKIKGGVEIIVKEINRQENYFI